MLRTILGKQKAKENSTESPSKASGGSVKRTISRLFSSKAQKKAKPDIPNEPADRPAKETKPSIEYIKHTPQHTSQPVQRSDLSTHISLKGDVLNRTGDHMERRVKVFERLSSTPAAAQLVHSLEIGPFIESGQWPDAAASKGYWKALNLALRATRNLKEFVMRYYSGPSGGKGQISRGDPQPLDLLFDMCGFRLRKLFVPRECIRRASSTLCSPYYVSRVVEELGVTGEPDAALDIQTAFPLLEVVEHMSGLVSVTQFLRSPSKVKAIYLGNGSEPYWPSEGQSFSEMRSLRFGKVWGIPWNRLTTSFPSLRFLRIDLEPDQFSERNNRMIVESLQSFPSMRKIKFGADSKETWSSFDSRLQLITQIFAVHTRLQTVGFEDEEWGRGGPNFEFRVTTGVPDDADEWKDKKWWD